MRRVGILGGSMDPPHYGHIYLSSLSAKILSLDEVWWLVCAKNPLKSKASKSLAERIAMSKSIVSLYRMNYKIRVLQYRTGGGYVCACAAVEKLMQANRDTRFLWICGADSPMLFHKWKNWKKLFSMLPVAVFMRGTDLKFKIIRSKFSHNFRRGLVLTNRPKSALDRYVNGWIIIRNKVVALSSTDVRMSIE